MRPHTLTTPKPLIRFAGKPMVEHLVEEIARSLDETIGQIAFVTGHFGLEAEQELLQSAARCGAEGRIYYQEEPLGTAHAVLCAAQALHGPVVIAFADTLFFCKEKLDLSGDAIIWTKKVEDPRAFGVVLTDERQRITGFAEKPETPISDQAIIGIYFFKDGDALRNELQFLIDNDIRKGNEYQLTDALQNMMEKGVCFFSAQVDQWLDCGNKEATLATHAAVLRQKGNHVDPGASLINTTVIPPCHIAAGCRIENSVIGPDVSVGADSRLTHCLISDAILQNGVEAEYAVLSHSMVGNQARLHFTPKHLSISDFSQIES